MIYKMMWTASCVVISLSICLTVSGQATKIVTPAGYQNVEGNGFANPAAVPTRIQFLIPSSDFADLPETQQWITSFNFRSDASQRSDIDQSFTNHQIWISTTDKTALTLSNQFSANHGTDKSLVQDGPVTYSYLGATGAPLQFADGPKFQTPFHYDPAQGNLLLELIQFDAPVNRIVLDLVDLTTPGNRVLLNQDSVTATSGIFLNSPAILQFEFVGVPEPSGSIFVLMGLAGGFKALCRTRRSLPAR